MRLFSALLLALTCAVGASTTATSTPSEAAVDRLLKLKQASHMFSDVMPAFEQALTRKKAYTEITADQTKKILETAQRVYRQKNLYDVFFTAYKTFASDASVKGELDMYGSKIGKLLGDINADSAKPDFLSRVSIYFQTKEIAALPQNRKNSLSSYLKTTKIADMVGNLHLGMDIGVDMAMNAFKPEVYRKTVKQLKAEGRQRRSNYIIDNAEATLTQLSYSFRTLTNNQIDWLTKYYLTRNGEANIEAYLKAYEITMDRAAKTTMDALLTKK